MRRHLCAGFSSTRVRLLQLEKPNNTEFAAEFIRSALIQLRLNKRQTDAFFFPSYIFSASYFFIVDSLALGLFHPKRTYVMYSYVVEFYFLGFFFNLPISSTIRARACVRIGNLQYLKIFQRLGSFEQLCYWYRVHPGLFYLFINLDGSLIRKKTEKYPNLQIPGI